MGNGKVEVILMEYRCRDFDERAFVLRILNNPFGGSRIQQVAWGVSPNFPLKTIPPLFPIYTNTTGFSKEANDKVRELPFRGKLVDHKTTFEEAVNRAYDLAMEQSQIYTKPSEDHPGYDPSGTSFIDMTSRGTHRDLSTGDIYGKIWESGIVGTQDIDVIPNHQLWYQEAWYPEI